MYQNKIKNEKTWLEDLPEIVNRKFPPRLANDVLKYWKPNEGKINDLCMSDSGVYFWGSIGIGKTVLASQILIQRLKQYYLEYKPALAFFINTTDLLEEIKNAYDNKEISESEIMSKYKNTDLLLIDDIGSENPSNWQISIMFNLINHRYEYLKYTLFTSNRSPEDLANVYKDDRITRRINDMCHSVVEKTTI
ncbi:MAG: ATP-binding protein [bacterium]